MSFSTAGGGPSRPEMNVTPLIDILLVLIIVFMVIVATSKEYVVNTQLPQEANREQPHQNERTIVIQIVWVPGQQNPLLKINQENVPWDDLEPALTRLRNAQPQGPQRMAVTILRADLLQPAPVEAHEISETAARLVEGIIQEGNVGRSPRRERG